MRARDQSTIEIYILGFDTHPGLITSESVSRLR